MTPLTGRPCVVHTDTLGVFLDFDENKAAFFMNRERVTKYFKIYSGTTTTAAVSLTGSGH